MSLSLCIGSDERRRPTREAPRPAPPPAAPVGAGAGLRRARTGGRLALRPLSPISGPSPHVGERVPRIPGSTSIVRCRQGILPGTDRGGSVTIRHPRSSLAGRGDFLVERRRQPPLRRAVAVRRDRAALPAPPGRRTCCRLAPDGCSQLTRGCVELPTHRYKGRTEGQLRCHTVSKGFNRSPREKGCLAGAACLRDCFRPSP